MLNNPNIEEDDLRALHHDAVQWAMYCVGFDQDDAREVVQQCYLKIVEGSARFSQKSSLKTWLFGVIRLTALETKRKQSLFLVADYQDPDDGAGETDENGAGGLEDNFPADRVEAAMNRLSLMQREIIYLAFYKELTLSEIAGVLDVSIGTIRTHYHRAKLKLAEQLAAGEDNGRLFEATTSSS